MPLSWNEIRDRAMAFSPMPPELVKAHQTLDRAVDAAYGVKGFATEAERVAFLFERYQQLVAPLVPRRKPAKRPQKNQ